MSELRELVGGFDLGFFSFFWVWFWFWVCIFSCWRGVVVGRWVGGRGERGVWVVSYSNNIYALAACALVGASFGGGAMGTRKEGQRGREEEEILMSA